MIISELIKKLELIKSNNGDIKIWLALDDETMEDDINFLIQKDDNESILIIEAIQ